MPPVLETQGLVKSFGGIVATNDVSLSVEKGARHALIGPNGAGKTTIINLLTGVLRPTAGRILLEGRDITALEPHKRVGLGIARTFQINQLFADLTPLETIGLAVSERMELGRQWWRLTGSKGIVIEESVDILRRFNLADVMSERTATLPYGKQRLLEIALAIACRPHVLLLDEPAAGVPEGERHGILDAVAALPERCHRAADRARHGHRVLLRGPHFGAGQRRAVRRGRARGGRGRSACEGGLSRGGGGCLSSSRSTI